MLIPKNECIGILNTEIQYVSEHNYLFDTSRGERVEQVNM